eukprot:COSAG03_NODE_3257_length_2121_cov_1.249753_1_plen_81_part_10
MRTADLLRRGCRRPQGPTAAYAELLPAATPACHCALRCVPVSFKFLRAPAPPPLARACWRPGRGACVVPRLVPAGTRLSRL